MSLGPVQHEMALNAILEVLESPVESLQGRELVGLPMR
jgi:hypothetical protein